MPTSPSPCEPRPARPCHPPGDRGAFLPVAALVLVLGLLVALTVPAAAPGHAWVEGLLGRLSPRAGGAGAEAGGEGAVPDDPPDLPATEPIVTLSLSQPAIGLGESVTLTLTVQNDGPSAQTLAFQTTLKADFTAERANRVVWQWSRDRDVQLSPSDLTLAPGQKTTFRASWDGRDDAGRDLPAGDYVVKGVFLGQWSKTSLPLVAEATIEVKRPKSSIT